MADDRYDIVRYFRDTDERHTLKLGVTLEEAKEHCNSPAASSHTNHSPAAARITALQGPWFDGFVKSR